LVGVKVAVMTELPAPTTVRVEPETLMTDVAADEYVKLPGIEPITEGAVTVKAESPKFFETPLQALKVGDPLPTVTVIVVVAVLYLVESVGVKVAVIIELPTPATVRVEPETLMTDGVPDEYVNEPAREFASVGAVTEKAGSPKFLETPLQALRVGLSLAIGAVLADVAKAEPLPSWTVMVTEMPLPISSEVKV
jgi:hypothetical protein